MNRLVAVGLVGVAVLIVVWCFFSQAYSGHSADVAGVPTTEESLKAPVEEPRAGNGGDVVAEADNERAEVANPLLSSRLTDQEGVPVPGARISWTPFLPAFLGVWAGWSLQDWAGVADATAMTTSGADGSFSFASTPPLIEGHTSTIWITHEAYVPAFFAVSIDPDARSLPGTIALTPGPETTVFVIDREDRPVAGASVQQVVPVPSDSRADTLDPQALRLLRRVAATGPDGTAPAFSWSGETLLRATHEGLQSEVWIGEPRERITLRLRPTFKAHGTVMADPTSQIEGPLRVLCRVQLGGQVRLLETAPVTGGSWGPVTLPLLPADTYSFHLEGWNAEVRETLIDPPPANSVQRIDFSTRAGLDVWFLVRNEDEEVLEESKVVVSWDVNGVRATTSGRVRDDGYTLVRGVPPGTMTITASAPGYAPKSLGPYGLPEEPPISHIVQLKAAGGLSGQVTFRGEPVEDFEITFWQRVSPLGSATRSFRAREGGSFVLEDVPLGTCWLVASASGTAPSGIQTVDVRPGDHATVLLELTDALVGGGR